MGHVGEEFGLVLARALQFYRAFFELDLGLIEFGILQVHGVALLGQYFCLLGELFVGLLQLHLLGFQVRLGLLENPRLLFELFVGGLEFFLLNLQFFVELLGFGQHLLQTLAITCRLDRGADVAGNQLKQFNVTVGQWTQKAQLDHAIDPLVVAGWHHQHTARQTVTEAGADLEVISRHLVQANQPCLLRHLADNAFFAVDLLFTPFLFTGKTISGDALEAAMVFAHINSRHGGAQVLRAELQDIATQHAQAQLSQHLLGQLGLAVAQPGLLLQTMGAGLLGGKVDAVVLRQGQQVAAPDVRQQPADPRYKQQVEADAHDGGAAHFVIARCAQLLLGVDHFLELLANFIGQALTASGLDDGAIITAAALQIDHRLRVVGPLQLQGSQP
ncbi:hypothetical protein D9M70_184240 [compost metagenome]